MKKKLLVLPLLATIFLAASCSENSSSGASSTGNSGGGTSSSSEQQMNWNDGTALEYTPVSDGYTLGTAKVTNSYDFDNVYANSPSKTLADDFIYGVDVSSLYEVEKAGGRFYDKDGNEDDIFNILKEGGSNYVRLRLWVDPFDSHGNSYGGGINDIATDIYLAQRAQKAGLKILIDFHYSDSWADPAKQWAPKDWMTLSSANKITVDERNQYQNVGAFTGQALNAFKNAGITVSAVQIGNETNNGMAGLSNAQSKFFADCVRAGVTTAESVFPEVETIIHLTNITSTGYLKVLNNLQERGVSWDITGLSYYPFWHGSRENLLSVMNGIVETYGTKVMVAETSWGYTGEGAEYCNNQFSPETHCQEGGYAASNQGQISELADIVEVLSQVPDQKGVGICYWEPAWLPLKGAGWISKYGAFYNDNGYDWQAASDLAGYSDSYCYSSWANQAWFDYDGVAMPSLYAYKYIQDGDKTVEVKYSGLLESKFSAKYNLGDASSSIPETGLLVSNIDTYVEEDIAWDSEQLASLPSTPTGTTVTLKGTCGGFDVTCDVLVYTNYVEDYSFESQNTLQSGNSNEYAVESPWELEASVSGVRVESKSEMQGGTGKKYFHWWSSTAFTFTLSQTLKDVPAGTYDLSTVVLTHLPTEYGGYNSIGLFYQIGDGEKVEVSMLDKCLGYAFGGTEWSIGNIVISSTSDVTIGMYGDAGATTWGHNDDWSFALA